MAGNEFKAEITSMNWMIGVGFTGLGPLIRIAISRCRLVLPHVNRTCRVWGCETEHPLTLYLRSYFPYTPKQFLR